MRSLLVILLLAVTTTSQAQWTQSYPRTSGGITWSIAGNAQTMFAGTDSTGIIRSTDIGLTWTSSGLSDRYITSLAFHGTEAYAGTDSGLYRSTNNGSSWQSVSAFVGMGIECLDFGSTAWYAATWGPGILRSTDNGYSWPPANNGLTDTYPRTILSNGSSVYVGTGSGIYTSTDYGTNWIHLPTNTGLYPNVRALALLGNILFAAGAGGVQRSTDYGQTWVEVDSGYDIYTQGFFHRLVVYHSTIFVCGWGGIFMSTDTGTSWTAINTGLPAATKIVSISQGDTTITFSPSSHSLRIVGSTLFAGVDDSGIWKRPLGEIVSSVASPFEMNAPGGFQLQQNFPNPFNPTTQIFFTVPYSSYVTIAVFDLLGRKVQTIVSGEYAAGTFSATWNAASLPSGVYICRLRAGSFQAARKMILQK